VRANFLDLRLVIDRSDRTFNQSEVDFIGIILAVDDGAVNDVDLFCELEEPLIHIKEGHMASRAAIQPNRCHLQLAHCASLIRFK